MYSLECHNQKRMKGNPILFSCDRANKSTYRVIKMVSFLFIDRVVVFSLDSDVYEGINLVTADEVDDSLKNMDTMDSNDNLLKTIINGLFSDAGGLGARRVFLSRSIKSIVPYL